MPNPANKTKRDLEKMVSAADLAAEKLPRPWTKVSVITQQQLAQQIAAMIERLRRSKGKKENHCE